MFALFFFQSYCVVISDVSSTKLCLPAQVKIKMALPTLATFACLVSLYNIKHLDMTIVANSLHINITELNLLITASQLYCWTGPTEPTAKLTGTGLYMDRRAQSVKEANDDYMIQRTENRDDIYTRDNYNDQVDRMI